MLMKTVLLGLVLASLVLAVPTRVDDEIDGTRRDMKEENRRELADKVDEERRALREEENKKDEERRGTITTTDEQREEQRRANDEERHDNERRETENKEERRREIQKENEEKKEQRRRELNELKKEQKKEEERRMAEERREIQKETEEEKEQRRRELNEKTEEEKKEERRRMAEERRQEEREERRREIQKEQRRRELNELKKEQKKEEERRMAEERREIQKETEEEKEQRRRELNEKTEEEKKEERRRELNELKKEQKKEEERREIQKENEEKKEQRRRELNELKKEQKKEEERRMAEERREKEEKEEERREIQKENEEKKEQRRRELNELKKEQKKEEERRETEHKTEEEKEERRREIQKENEEEKEQRRRELNEMKKEQTKEEERRMAEERREKEENEERRREVQKETEEEKEQRRRELNNEKTDEEKREERRETVSQAEREKRRPIPAIKGEKRESERMKEETRVKRESEAQTETEREQRELTDKKETRDVQKNTTSNVLSICDSVTDFKYYQKYESDASKYIECNPWGSGNVKSCAHGLLWNEWTLRCDAKERIHNMTLDLSKFSVTTAQRPVVNCSLVGMECLNGGSCVQAVTGDYKCACRTDYTGQFCESRVDLTDITHEILNSTFSLVGYRKRLEEENITMGVAYYEKYKDQLDNVTYTELVRYLRFYKDGEVRYDTLVNSLIEDILENIYPDAEYLSVFNASEQNVITMVQMIPSLLSYSRYSFERYEDVFAQYQHVLVTLGRLLNTTYPNISEEASQYTLLTRIFLNQTLTLIKNLEDRSLVEDNQKLEQPIQLSEEDIKKSLKHNYNETQMAAEKLIQVLETFQASVLKELETNPSAVMNLTLGQAKFAGAQEVLAVLSQVSVASFQIWESLVNYGFWYLTNLFSTSLAKVDSIQRFSFNLNKF